MECKIKKKEGKIKRREKMYEHKQMKKQIDVEADKIESPI